MQKILFTTMVVAGFVNAQTITHNSGLKCGRCIDGGFNFCIRRTQDNGSTRSGNPSDQTCCSDNNCGQMNNGDWICSAAYKNPIYAKNICNFDTNFCGANRMVNLAKAGESATAGVQKLGLGETCSYMVKSACGAVSMNATVANGAVDVQLLEWDSSAVQLNAPVFTGALDNNGKNSKDTGLTLASPFAGFPRRNATLGYMLAQNTFLTSQNMTVGTSAFQKAVAAKVMVAMKALQTANPTGFVNPVWTASSATRASTRATRLAGLNGGQGVLTNTSTNLTKNAAGKTVLETLSSGTATYTGNQVNCANRTLFVAVTSVATDNGGQSEASMTFTSMQVSAPAIVSTEVATGAVMKTLGAMAGAAALMWM